MSQGTYSTKQIEAMEVIILTGLSWRVCAPSSVQVANHILSLVRPLVDLKDSTWGFILDEVRFQTEIAVRDHSLSVDRPTVHPQPSWACSTVRPHTPPG